MKGYYDGWLLHKGKYHNVLLHCCIGERGRESACAAEDGGWTCINCEARAPQEMCDVADLARCATLKWHAEDLTRLRARRKRESQ